MRNCDLPCAQRANSLREQMKRRSACGDWQAATVERLLDAPVAGLGDMNRSRPMQRRETEQLAGQRATVGRIVEPYIVHRHAAQAQCSAKWRMALNMKAIFCG